MNKHHFVDSARALSTTFSDSGLFGLQVSGSAANGNELLAGASAELKGLTAKVSEAELAKAKAQLKTDLLLSLER